LCLVKGAPEWVLEHCQRYQSPTANRATSAPDAKNEGAGTTRRRRPKSDADARVRLGGSADERRQTKTLCTPSARNWRSDLVFVGFVAIAIRCGST